MKTLRELLNGRLPCSALEQELVEHISELEISINHVIKELTYHYEGNWYCGVHGDACITDLVGMLPVVDQPNLSAIESADSE